MAMKKMAMKIEGNGRSSTGILTCLAAVLLLAGCGGSGGGGPFASDRGGAPRSGGGTRARPLDPARGEPDGSEFLARLRRDAGELRTEIRSAERRLRALTPDESASRSLARELAKELWESGIQVTPRGPSVVVAIADRVLFAPGEAALKDDARKRLKDLAALLKERFPDRVVAVEGHTDSVPPKKTAALYPTNWELSAARAVTVARKLTEEGGLSPGSVVASAFAETRPVEENETPEGRAANRRVEIVIMPAIPTARVSAAFDE